jgi:hypothetical protein
MKGNFPGKRFLRGKKTTIFCEVDFYLFEEHFDSTKSVNFGKLPCIGAGVQNMFNLWFIYKTASQWG